MKRVYLLILLVKGVFLNAQVVFEPTLEVAFAKAKQQDKPVFIEYYNSDCSVCKRLGDLLREDAAIGSYFNTNFISYAMNTYGELSEKDNALITTAGLHFESVPVLLFFDKNKNFLHYSSGDITPEVVINEAKKAVLPEYNTAGLKLKYDSGDRSVRTLFAYANALKIMKNEEKLKKVAQELFESFDKVELPTKKSYIILKQVVTSSDNGFFKYWMNNLSGLEGFEKGHNAGNEKLYLQTILLKELSDPNIKKWNTAKKNKYKNYIVKLKMSENPNVFFQ